MCRCHGSLEKRPLATEEPAVDTDSRILKDGFVPFLNGGSLSSPRRRWLLPVPGVGWTGPMQTVPGQEQHVLRALRLLVRQ